jgi:hypothetical protein
MAATGSNKASSTNDGVIGLENKSVTETTFIEAQNALVMMVANDMGRDNWERIFVDAEILEQSDGFDVDTISKVIVRDPGDTLSAPQFSLSAASRKAISELYIQRKEEAGEVIGGFELTVDYPGKFNFKYNLSQPKRLNGIWDAERQGWIENYLQHYKTEIGG